METDSGHIVQFHKATTDSFLLTTCDHETGEVSSLLIPESDGHRLYVFLKSFFANPAAYAPLHSGK